MWSGQPQTATVGLSLTLRLCACCQKEAFVRILYKIVKLSLRFASFKWLVFLKKRAVVCSTENRNAMNVSLINVLLFRYQTMCTMRKETALQ